MHNAEAAIEPAFYDHEDDIVQRDRVAADWGADEVFATVPRRRFRGDHHPAAGVQRRGAHTAVVREDDEDAAERAAWLAEVEAEVAAPGLEVVPADEATMTEGLAFEEPVAVRAEAAPEPAGRRTVTITGRPEARSLPATARRRPPRTVDERIGSRPDRVAGWAFGMSLLLIAVAAVS